MSTKNKPGIDSYYFVSKDTKIATVELNKYVVVSKDAKVITASNEIKSTIIGTVKRSKYIWHGDTRAMTAKGDIILEIGKDMMDYQNHLFNNAQDNLYDKVTIRPLLPKDILK